MEQLPGLIGLGVVLFIATNLDDIFVLLAFFSDSTFGARQIITGQFLGIGVLYALSVVASLLSLVIDPAWIGLLGLAPIAIGVKKLWDRWRDEEESQDPIKAAAGQSRVMTVAAVTLANGGDNLGIYTPLFASRSGHEIALLGLVFAVMTIIWLWAAHWLTRHRTWGASIRRYGNRLAPFVLIALGVLILLEANTLSLLRRP